MEVGEKPQSWGWSSTEWRQPLGQTNWLRRGGETAPSLFCGSAITKLQGKPNMHMNDGAGRGGFYRERIISVCELSIHLKGLFPNKKEQSLP